MVPVPPTPMTPTADDVGAGPPPRWAVWCAWAVPLTIAPSAAWRVWTVFTDDRGVLGSVTGGGWYLLLLSVVSMALGLLTVGLVRPWGEVFPRWIPFVGGRVVPARGATRAAVTGGTVLILITIYFFALRIWGDPSFRVPVWIGDDTRHPPPGWSILRYYAPLIAWGPLVIAVARDYRRRRATSARTAASRH